MKLAGWEMYFLLTISLIYFHTLILGGGTAGAATAPSTLGQLPIIERSKFGKAGQEHKKRSK